MTPLSKARCFPRDLKRPQPTWPQVHMEENNLLFLEKKELYLPSLGTGNPLLSSLISSAAVTTSSSNSNNGLESSRPRPPPLAHSAKKSVFSVSNLSSVNEEPKPSGMMLWKKVQTYVAVGGAFVSSAAANNGTNEQHQSNAATTASSSLVKTVTTTQPPAVTTVTHWSTTKRGTCVIYAGNAFKHCERLLKVKVTIFHPLVLLSLSSQMVFRELYFLLESWHHKS